VEAVAGRVILIHGGRIVFDGTPDEMAAGKTIEKAFHELTSDARGGAQPPVERSAGAA
jgi:ABC-type multidrug transport system ATPase subunit